MEFRAMNEQEIRDWYDREFIRTFPPNEQKPLPFILDLIAGGRYTLLGLYDGPSLLGYASLQTSPDRPGYILLDYLGVTAARRNGGLGSRILSLLEKRFGKNACLIIEAESPVPGGDEAENALRVRRIGFYERCGCRRAYEIGACGIRCQALTLGDPGNPDALTEAHQAIYGPGRPDITIPLGLDETPAPAHWGKDT
ncbi:GNAT family N-acetyltransferase [Oscillospiraceae bacterium 50-60]|nr:GNAT family N-acetyltransferase [Oscillibacter sp.]